MEGMHRSRERFMGYCSDRQGEMVEPALADVWQRLVCFEYLPRGSPADPSHGPEWRKPYQITGGICDGLYYLHIVHFILQPTNILLDYNMMSKIVDFDLSRCYHEKQNWLITSNLIGTIIHVGDIWHQNSMCVDRCHSNQTYIVLVS
ncbi:hypothetical protein ACQ4PT_057199 [Festuca glaucescens]